jgi:hypothetical protein
MQFAFYCLKKVTLAVFVVKSPLLRLDGAPTLQRYIMLKVLLRPFTSIRKVFPQIEGPASQQPVDHVPQFGSSRAKDYTFESIIA